LIKYDIIPSDYNICTIYDELSENNKRNIQLYSKLSYIKINSVNKTLTIDNILLHIIIDYYNNTNQINDIFKDMVKVIIVSSLYLGQQVNIEKVVTQESPAGKFPKWDPSQEISEIFFLYNTILSQRNVVNFSVYFNAFMEEFFKLFNIEGPMETIDFDEINEEHKEPIIIQINNILSLHGHMCKIGSIEFNDVSDNEPKTYYFGSQSIQYTNQTRDGPGTDYEAEYTYIKGLIMNNSIQLSLLTRYGDSSINEGEYHGNYGYENEYQDQGQYQDQYQDQEQYNNYYGGGYEDEYEYENKYVDF
jgi:hypothetical protein